MSRATIVGSDYRFPARFLVALFVRFRADLSSDLLLKTKKPRAPPPPQKHISPYIHLHGNRYSSGAHFVEAYVGVEYPPLSRICPLGSRLGI